MYAADVSYIHFVHSYVFIFLFDESGETSMYFLRAFTVLWSVKSSIPVNHYAECFVLHVHA